MPHEYILCSVKAYFVRDRARIEEQLLRVDRGSLVIIGHEAGIAIDLVRELDGDSDIMKRLSAYSRRKDIVLFCGIEAKIYTHTYLSVLVVDRGKIIGISDATHDVHEEREYSLGTTYRLYATSLGRVGVVVGEDIYYPEVARGISSHNAEYIVVLAGKIEDNMVKDVLRVTAYLMGICMLGIVGASAYVIDETGAVVCEREDALFEGEMRRDRRFERHLRRNIYDNVYIEE